MDPALVLNQPPSPQHQSGMFTQSCSENNLKFICKFEPGPGPLQVSGNEDYNVNTDCESVSVILPAQCSVYQLRLRICMQVGNTPPHRMVCCSKVCLKFSLKKKKISLLETEYILEHFVVTI